MHDTERPAIQRSIEMGMTENGRTVMAYDLETAQLLRRARAIVLEVCGECPHALVSEVFRRLDALQLERGTAGAESWDATWH